MPPEFWHLSEIDWDKIGQRRRGEFHWYGDVTIAVVDLKRTFPDPLNELTPPKTVTTHGRPKEYDELEFLRLCIWEANQNGLDDKPASCVRRMEELLAVVWGEQATPGLTWIKQKVSAIYKARDRYERGRQLAPGDGSADR